jgi:diadenosine tetraphosphate (Ap4A) HIT family hydrolase
MRIYERPDFSIEVHESEIPWLKIFTVEPYKELTDVPKALRHTLYDVMECVEEQMRAYYQPEKINIAAFGNYLPHLHIHVMARFKEDAYYPEPMWGEKQRDSDLNLPEAQPFYQALSQSLDALLGA